MFTWHGTNKRKFPFPKSTIGFDLQCVWIDIQKRSKTSKWMLLLLKNYASLHMHLTPTHTHTLTHTHGYLSLTSLHLSFHLLLIAVSHNPKSLLRARKLQLKLSQSGTQLRLPGDLTGKKKSQEIGSKSKLLTPQVVYILFVCTTRSLRSVSVY